MKTNIKYYVIVLLMLSAILKTKAQDHALSLDEALRLAKENNKTLQVRSYEEKFAKEETRIAKANLLPAVSASGNYSYYFDRQVIFMPGSFTGEENIPVVDVAVGGKNAFNTYVSITQPVLSESARRQVRASKINEAIQEATTKDQKENLALHVSITYLRALLLHESIKLNRQSLERNLRSLDDSRSLLRQGKSLKVDTLRNFIVVENLKTTISYTESQLKITMLQLTQMIGLAHDGSVTLTDSLRHETDARYLAAVDLASGEALANRSDIQQMKLQIELNKNFVSQSKAQRIPTLSLVGAYQLQAQADNRKLDGYRWPKTSFVGIQANLPLFSGNRINSKIRQSNIRLQQSQLELSDANDKAKTEIATLENNLKEVYQRLHIQVKTVQAAEMNYKIVNDRYRNGLSSRLELSDAELALTEAKMNQLNSIYNVKIAKLQLDKALGLLHY